MEYTEYKDQVNSLLEDIKELEELLVRSVKYNATAQKARVKSIIFEKTFKKFRKDSVQYFKDKKLK